MAKRNIVQGQDLMVFVGGKAVALAKSHKLTLTGSTVDNATKDDGAWDAQDIGNLSWEATSEGLYGAAVAENATDLAYAELFDMMVAKRPVDVVTGIAANASNDGVPDGGWTAPTAGAYQGQALITSLELNAEKGSASTLSVTLTGYGPLKKTATGA